MSDSTISRTTPKAGLAGNNLCQLRLAKMGNLNDPATTAADVAAHCQVVFVGTSIRNACARTNDEGSRRGEGESSVGLKTGYKSNIATSAERGMQKCDPRRSQNDRVKLHKGLRSVTRQLVDNGLGPLTKCRQTTVRLNGEARIAED